MNDLEYFPTPSNVIIEMLHGMGKSDLSKMNILEPSAGEGDICDYLTNNKGVSLSSIKCIEKNYNRCEKLRKKGYTVIDYDFLEHKNDSFYDLILMNPPFSKAEKHLEKALEIGNGAEIRCLVSSGTVNATNLSERKRLEQKLEKLELEKNKIDRIATDGGWGSGCDYSKPINHFLSNTQFILWSKILARIHKNEKVLMDIRIYNHKLNQSLEVIKKLTATSNDFTHRQEKVQ